MLSDLSYFPVSAVLMQDAFSSSNPDCVLIIDGNGMDEGSQRGYSKDISDVKSGPGCPVVPGNNSIGAHPYPTGIIFHHGIKRTKHSERQGDSVPGGSVVKIERSSRPAPKIALRILYKRCHADNIRINYFPIFTVETNSIRYLSRTRYCRRCRRP
jgi:hypothetical protein